MRRLAAMLTLALTASSIPAVLAAQTDEILWRGEVAQGDWLEIRGVNGPVRAVAAEGDVAEVQATLRGRRSPPESVRIEVIEDGDGVTVCAVYPTPPDSPVANTCTPGGGSNSVQDNDVEVEFLVRVPAGVHLSAHTVNGEIDIEGLRGDADASTVNGDVEVETTGFVHNATTVNGDIELTLGELLDAHIHIGTVTGTIESDFPIELRGRMRPQTIRGTIGAGGPELRLSTVNGDIRIRRR